MEEQSPVSAGPWRLVSPSPLEWFYLAAGLFLAMSYLWFLDDAFVYFRYVDNLLFLRIGLVYNAGEYVEGYSSPFWTLLLIGLRATGMSFKAIIQLGCGVGFTAFWYMLVLLNRRMAPPDAPLVNFPLAYLGFNYAVLSYFSSGLETPLVQAGAAAYALYILVPGSRLLQVCIGLSPLVRPELILPLLIVSVWAWFRLKKPPYLLLAIAGATLSAWMLFRVYYYADLYPNTYYLKNVDDWEQGFKFLTQTVYTYYLPETCLLSMLVALAALRAGRRLMFTERSIMVLAALPVVIYVVKIGGDPRHYRYLAFPFILTACALAGNVETLLAHVMRSPHRRWAPVTGLAIALLAFSLYPRQLSGHPLLFYVRTGGADGIADAAGHRNNPGLAPPIWERQVNPEVLRRNRASQLGFTYDNVQSRGACWKSYTDFRSYVVHLLGLTDAILARTVMPAERPAHKLGLIPLGDDLAHIHRKMRYAGIGMYREAIKRGYAKPWIEDNIESIEMIERKIYNEHRLLENIQLALTPVPPIVPFELPPEPAEGDQEHSPTEVTDPAAQEESGY